MFDLNLSTAFSGEESPETSTENVEAESSSSKGDASAGSGCAAAANAGNDRVDDDDRPDQGSGLLTRELFPVSRIGELKRGWLQIEAADLPPLSAGLRLPRMAVQQEVQQVQARKSRRGPRSRSSQYRGVTFYRRTGRWESHIWDCGKQVYLGGFDTALAAARAYDRAAIRFRGVDADINFNLGDYNDVKEMMNLSKEEFVHILRRQSTGFSRGSSKYRGVTLHKCGRWEARMGQFLGKKAYDKAVITHNGSDAVTNFEPSAYKEKMPSQHQNEGCQHDLTLNLGMSVSPMKESKSTTLKLNVGNSAVNSIGNPPLNGVPVTSEYPILYSSELASDQRNTTISPPELTNWAWQMHGYVQALPNATSATAASSGFSSMATTAPATPVPTGFSSYPIMLENACVFQSWIKPFLPQS